MRHRNRTGELAIVVKVIGGLGLALAFGYIASMGSRIDEEEVVTEQLGDNDVLSGDASQLPTEIAQVITTTRVVTLTPTPGNTKDPPDTELEQQSLPTDRPKTTPTATPTLMDTATPGPTLTATTFPTATPTFTLFPVTLTDTLTPTEVPCELMQDWDTYVVQPDDSLYDLAVKFQTSMETLQVGNCLTSLDIQGGQVLYVPPIDTFASFSVAPLLGCDNPRIRITSPAAGETVTDGWEIVGVADPPDFGFYKVDIRRNTTDQLYETLFESNQRVGDGNRIGFLNFRNGDSDGAYWVRLQVYDSTGQASGGCEVCVSLGAGSGNCSGSREKPRIPPPPVAVNPPSLNAGQYNLFASLKGCSPTVAGGSSPVVNPMGGAYIVRQEITSYHSGIDLSAPTGTPVLAASSGSVVFAGWSEVGYGNTIVIAHDTTFTLYAHLSAIGVSCGQAVQAGQPIGGVGSTGRSSGPHLHFEVRDADGTPHNPRNYVDFSACSGGWC